jgi:hypothetical protein
MDGAFGDKDLALATPSNPLEMPRVSVIVSEMNSARTLRHCIECLLHQDYPANRYSVLVVDAGSTDDSIAIVNSIRDPRLQIRIVSGCSEAEGQIEGVRATESDFLMFTNSDIYVPRSWISRHIYWHNQGYDLVGGKVFWGGDKFAFSWNLPSPKEPRFVAESGLGIGFSNCSVSRQTYNRAGGIRAIKSQHDADFVVRALATGGLMILDPVIEVIHDHPFKSLSGSFERAYGYAVNHISVLRTHYGTPLRNTVIPVRAPFESLFREVTLVNGILTYREYAEKAGSQGIHVGIIEFLYLRLAGRLMGHLIGILSGLLLHRETVWGIQDLHKKVGSTGL